MNEVDIIKLATLAYWRYGRGHVVGAIECNGADVKTMTRSLMVAETEVKVSIADMRREVKTKRYKHEAFNGLRIPSYYNTRVNYFYFVVPERLKDKALVVVKELYPYAGLLVCRGKLRSIYGYWGEPSNIYSLKPAKRMARDKPDMDEIVRMGYAASNTALRYGEKLVQVAGQGSS